MFLLIDPMNKLAHLFGYPAYEHTAQVFPKAN